MENKPVLSLLDFVKSLKNTEIYPHMDKEIDAVVEFLSLKDLTENFSEFEKLVYSFKNIPKVYFLSILLSVTDVKQKHLSDILRIVVNEEDMPINTKYFLLYQCANFIFNDESLKSDEIKKQIWDIYFQIYSDYKAKFSPYLEFIPKEQRNEKLIFIFVPQILSLDIKHTKSALDTAYWLKKLGYEVIVINTTELLSQSGAIPFYASMIPDIDRELKKQNSIEYLGENIPYFQCSEFMPNIQEIEMILNIVKEHKPFMALTLGFYNVTADLCSNIIPVAGISTLPLQMPTTLSQFHVTDKKVEKSDLEFVSLFGFGEENVISHFFEPMFGDEKTSDMEQSIKTLIEEISQNPLFK